MGMKICPAPIAVMIKATEIHQYIVLYTYTSAGVPKMVIAEIKLDSSDIATGNGCMPRPARR